MLMSQQLKTVAFSFASPDSRAWLVLTSAEQEPHVVEMCHEPSSVWSASADLIPGDYRCRYYSGDDRNVIYYGPAHIEGSTDGGMDALMSVKCR